jgi:hypothetical protein
LGSVEIKAYIKIMCLRRHTVDDNFSMYLYSKLFFRLYSVSEGGRMGGGGVKKPIVFCRGQLFLLNGGIGKTAKVWALDCPLKVT